MRNRIAVAIGFATIMVAWGESSPTLAQDKKPSEARVARLVHDLGADSFRTRRAAEEELVELGLTGRKAIQDAAKSTDPEVRIRAQRLLKQFQLVSLWAGSPVQIPAGTTQVSEVVKALSAQSENPISLGDQYGTFHEGNVNLASRHGEFWPTLDTICRASGNRVRPHFGSRRGLVIIDGEPTNYPTAYSGPIRAQITSAKRKFTEELDYENGESETTHTFELNVRLFWEQRFRLAAYRAGLSLVGAETAQGGRITADAHPDRSWSIAEPSTRQISTTLTLSPPSPNSENLRTLVVAWELIAVGEMTTLQIDQPEAGAVSRQDDMRVAIEELKQTSETRWEMTVAIARELPVPDPDDVLFRENEVELYTESGKPFRTQGQKNLDIEGSVARITYSFLAPSSDDRPGQLRINYPQLRDRRSLEIIFRDVPLPVAVPE